MASRRFRCKGSAASRVGLLNKETSKDVFGGFRLVVYSVC